MELFEMHAAALHRFALRYVDYQGAEDVVAETFLAAWRRLDDLPDAPLAWLYRTARNVIANRQRGDARRLALVNRLVLNTPTGEVPPDVGAIEALGLLGEADRDLLILIAWEGLTSKEAAQVLGCTPGALAVRLHRARRRYAAALSESPPAVTPRPSLEAPR